MLFRESLLSERDEKPSDVARIVVADKISNENTAALRQSAHPAALLSCTVRAALNICIYFVLYHFFAFVMCAPVAPHFSNGVGKNPRRG